jgi:hypothetical protein
VATGRIDAPSPNQTTWLPPGDWEEGFAW